jgi:hypothetical protein
MLLGGSLTLGAWRSRLHEMAAMVLAAGVPLFHSDEEKPLYLFSGDHRPLRLAPFIALRRCRICHRIDVFCFDGRAGRSERDRFGFVDFALGHALVLPNHRVPELASGASEPWSAGPLEGDLDDPFSDREVEARLEAATLRARYLRPIHLRGALADLSTWPATGCGSGRAISAGLRIGSLEPGTGVRMPKRHSR